MNNFDFAVSLAKTEKEEDVISLLKNLGYWDNYSRWRALGDNDNNYSIIGNQQSSPDAAFVEKMINSIDACLNKECLSDARFITFSDAVNTLSMLDKESKEGLMDLFRKITLADGMCNKDEALLMIALEYCLEGSHEADMIHIQVPQQGLQLDNSQVIYVEAEYDETVNDIIKKNYQQMENAMRLAGFNFAYIPQISETYRTTPPILFNEVMSFLTPNLDDSELALVQKKISSMTTAQFCKEQLCQKLHINCLLDTHPSFLMKVGETISESTIYANFLRIVIGDNVLDEIKQFMYRFTSMMNSEYSILRNIFNIISV